jgi:ubiquinone/menaquinone biosynthesis C-methylase UbiE
MSSERLAQAIADVKNGLAPVPPQEEIFVGDGDYAAISVEYLDYFVNVAGLEPNGAVLDMGSGIGRMACGLSRYLDPETGSYTGFDPVHSGVEWCRKAYAEFPNFQFEWVDLYNELYRPDGHILSTQYRFPAEDGSIDLTIATSIFTHLYEPEVAAYYREIARVLKPSGRSFSTAYLFDGDAPPNGGPSHIAFNMKDEDYPHRWHVENMPPLSAVCFSSAYFARLVEECTGRMPDIRPGRWRGGPGPWFQDLVLL